MLMSILFLAIIRASDSGNGQKWGRVFKGVLPKSLLAKKSSTQAWDDLVRLWEGEGVKSQHLTLGGALL